MKILLANSTCKRGGISTFMLSLRSALLTLGHECELFFFQHGPMEPYLPADCRAHFGDLADGLRLIARERFEVVHANNVDWSTGLSAVRHAGARLILTSHQSRATAWTYGWTAANCDAFVTVSRWLKEDLQPFTDAPIQVVMNGIDVRRFSPAPRPMTAPSIVAWVGRGTSRQKALERFAAIAAPLRQAGMRIWIVDQHGPERVAESFPAMADLLHPLAEFWGAVPFERMPDLYRDVAASGGCLVSTSRWEGLPLTLLEAQACGCPVIATDIPGTDECVFPEHGAVLYPEQLDPQALSCLVLDTLADRDRMRARQNDAATYVRSTFSLERMAEQYVSVYQHASYPWTGSVRARVRGRWRLSPLVHWADYLTHRWGVGQRQYESSRALGQRGEWALAAAAARASLRTAPTLYVKPRRLVHLIRTTLRERANKPAVAAGFSPIAGPPNASA